ncbi:phenylacetaldoxime dehydratase family protein [Streptomyces nogalater]
MAKRSSVPARHAPRFPAFTGVFPPGCTAYVMGQYGVQSAADATHETAAAEMRERFRSASRPDVVDRGSFTDSSGLTNTVWFAYWLEPRHRSWVAEGQRSAPFQEAGWWWEEALIPVEATETLHTHRQDQYPTSGLAEILDQEPTELHDYWGSARDRMRNSSAPPTRGAALEIHDSTVDVVVEGGICLIRTAQDWSGSSVFRLPFLQKVQPVKKEVSPTSASTRKPVAYARERYPSRIWMGVCWTERAPWPGSYRSIIFCRGPIFTKRT